MKVELNTEKCELTILEGKALDPKPPKKILIVGNIDAVDNFLSKRYDTQVVDIDNGSEQFVNPELTVVIVNESGLYVHLQLNPTNEYGFEIKAELKLADELKEFSINEAKTFTREELVRKVKFAGRFFDTPDAHQKLLLSYMKLNLSVNSSIKAESDDRGNRDMAYKKSIESQGVPEDFILNIPIFKGKPKERFRVQICLDVTDGGARFWFESVELAELLDVRSKEYLAKAVERCTDFPIIYQ